MRSERPRRHQTSAVCLSCRGRHGAFAGATSKATASTLSATGGQDGASRSAFVIVKHPPNVDGTLTSPLAKSMTKICDWIEMETLARQARKESLKTTYMIER